MSWFETTLRKGTKSPKICRDMFITDSKGLWRFCEVKNGRLFNKQIIERGEAMEYIDNAQLVSRPCCFNGCYTFRTAKSWGLIDSITAS